MDHDAVFASAACYGARCYVEAEQSDMSGPIDLLRFVRAQVRLRSQNVPLLPVWTMHQEPPAGQRLRRHKRWLGCAPI